MEEPETNPYPRLHFEGGFDERAKSEAELRGYRSHVILELAGGLRYPVFFFSVGRLAQELEEEAKLGRPYVAEHGMIIVKDVTIENMSLAAKRLVEEGFFANQKAL